MAYDYSQKQIERWDWAEQSAIYREKYLHQIDQTSYWKARALSASKQVAA